MKRKLLTTTLAVLAVVLLSFGVSACVKNAHHYVKNVVEPGCEQGYTEYVCSSCGESYREDYVDAHHSVSKVEEVLPTCSKDGHTAYYLCLNCGKMFSDENGKNEIIDKNSVVTTLPHNLNYVEAKSATCAADGNKAYYECLNCGKWFSDEKAENEITDKSSVIIPATAEVYMVKGQPATCTEVGNITYYVCVDCGKWFSDEKGENEITDKQSVIIPIDKDAHNFGEWTTVTAATCTEAGEEKRICKNDSTHVETREIKALGHSYNEGVVTTEPTCTTEGVKTYTCTKCDDTKTEIIAALGHDVKKHEAKAATCTEKGWNAYEECTRCDYTTYEEIAPLGHKEGAAVEENRTEATCETAGSYDLVTYCTVCKSELSRETKTIPAKGHTEVVDKAVEPTCTETGLTEGKHCSVCNTVLVKQEVVDAKGHTEVVDKAVEPTCTETGLTEGKHCSVCNTVLVKQEVVDAKGHTEVVDKAVEPTCTETGLTEGKHCSVCDTVLVKQEVVEAKGHTEVVDEAVEPTCTETGLTEGKHCSVCNTVLVKQEVVDAKGHTEVVDKAVEPTCTETGLTEGKHCSVCNTVLVEQTEAPAKGHTEVVDKAVEPTCTETGLTEGKHCSVCNTVLVKQEVVDAKGHTEVVDKAVEPTCTETGLTEGKHCSVCNTITVEQIVIEALGHDYKTVVTAPTCTEEGYTTYTCTRCDNTYADNYIEPTGHTWGVFADNGDDTHSRTCSVCSETETAGHSYSDWTCDDKNGGHSHNCAECTATQNEAHSWNGNLCKICNCKKLVEEWQLVTDANTLSAGDKLVIASNTKDAVAGEITSQYLQKLDATFSENRMTIVTLPDGAMIFTLGGSEGAWTFANRDGQLLGATAKGKLAWDKGTTTWSITLESGNATVQNGNSSTDYGRFLHNVNSPRFTTYTSATNVSMLLPQIYKYVNICRDHKAGTTIGHEGEYHWNICDTCGNMFGEKVAHTYTEVTEIPSTCVTAGTAAHFKCEICNTLFADTNGSETTIDKLALELAAHTLGDWHEGTATCTEAGTIGYYECSVCHKYFDQDGTTELPSIEGTTALGHNYSEVWTTDETGHWYACSRCDVQVDFAAHTLEYNHDETQHWQVCSVCQYQTEKVDHAYEDTDCVCGSSLKGTKEFPYTVSEALAEAGKLAENATTEAKVYVTAKIKSIGTTGSYLQNVYLEDTTDNAKEILLYSCNFTESVKAVYVNDTVVVLGYLKNFNGTLEIVGVKPDYATFESRTAGTSEITSQTDVNATVSAPADGINGETFTFTVTVNSGFEIAKVTVNGTEVTAENGTYTTTVAGPTEIVVATKEIGAVDSNISRTINIKTVATNNSYASGTAYTPLNIDDTNIIIEGLGGGNNAKYYSSDNSWRLYTGGTLKISVASGCELVSINVNFSGAITGLTSKNDYLVTETEKSTLTFSVTATTKITELTIVYRSHEHTYSALIPEVPATCSETGTKAHYTCTECNMLFIDIDGVKTKVEASELTIATIPHTFGEWLSNNDGTHSRTCSACSQKATEDCVDSDGDGKCNACQADMGEAPQPAEPTTVTQTSFTATDSDNINGDTNVSYSTAKGGGTSNPGIYNNEIRLYQNSAGTGGGTITITAKNGTTIKSITIGSSQATSVAYTVGVDTTKSATQSLPANGTVTFKFSEGVTSVTIHCMGTEKAQRLNINHLEVAYA